MGKDSTAYQRGRINALTLRLDGEPCGQSYIAAGYECRKGNATTRTVNSALKLAGKSAKKLGSRAIAAVKAGRQGTSRKTEQELEALFEEVTGQKPVKLNRARSAMALRRAKVSTFNAISSAENLGRRI